jgi:hypothetical protein
MSLPTHLTAMVLVPVVDQGTKWFLHRMLGSRMLDPSWLGAMRLVRAHTWIARLGASSSGPTSLLVWASAAAPLLVASPQLPATASSFVGQIWRLSETSRP